MTIEAIFAEYKKLNPESDCLPNEDAEIERIEAIINFEADDFNLAKLNGVEYQSIYKPFPKGTWFDSERWKADRVRLFQSDDKNASIFLRDYIMLPAGYEGGDIDVYELERCNIN